MLLNRFYFNSHAKAHGVSSASCFGHHEGQIPAHPRRQNRRRNSCGAQLSPIPGFSATSKRNYWPVYAILWWFHSRRKHHPQCCPLCPRVNDKSCQLFVTSPQLLAFIFLHRVDPASLLVVAGEHSLSQESGLEQVRFVSNTTVHKQFDFLTYENDISLIFVRHFYTVDY